MNIIAYLDKKDIILGIKPKNKKTIISAILDRLVKSKKIKKADRKDILKAILQREDMGSTAIGGNIALPHARIKSVNNVVIAFVVSKEGVLFGSLDQEPVHIIALILSNQNEAGQHLKVLAFLARMLRDKFFVNKIKNTSNEDEIISLLESQQQSVS